MKQDIIKLQEFVKDNAIDAYVVFTSDDHGSEYIVDRFKTREFLCGFTGSAGTLVVTKDNAYLWTDGRYFIQAAEQLKATDPMAWVQRMNCIRGRAEEIVREEIIYGEAAV